MFGADDEEVKKIESIDEAWEHMKTFFVTEKRFSSMFDEVNPIIKELKEYVSEKSYVDK